MDSYALYALIGIGPVLLAVAALRLLQHRRATARDLTREQRARLRDQGQLRESMEQLLQQLEEVSRRINTQAEGQISRLERLVTEADERIEQLERLSPAGAVPIPNRRPKTRAAEPKSVEAGRIGRVVESICSAGSKCAPEPPPAVSQPRRARVYELADTGADAATIADTLQLPLGEVELMLNLRRYART